MNKCLVKVTATAVSFAMLGCATRPENVAAHYVSGGRYDTYDCKKIVVEAEEVDARVRQLTGTLESKANTDAALVGVGLLLFWPALLALPATGGKAEEQELGRLKGEAEALQRSYKQKECANQISPATAAAPPATDPAAQPAVVQPLSPASMQKTSAQ